MKQIIVKGWTSSILRDHKKFILVFLSNQKVGDKVLITTNYSVSRETISLWTIEISGSERTNRLTPKLLLQFYLSRLEPDEVPSPLTPVVNSPLLV